MWTEASAAIATGGCKDISAQVARNSPCCTLANASRNWIASPKVECLFWRTVQGVESARCNAWLAHAYAHQWPARTHARTKACTHAHTDIHAYYHTITRVPHRRLSYQFSSSSTFQFFCLHFVTTNKFCVCCVCLLASTGCALHARRVPSPRRGVKGGGE